MAYVISAAVTPMLYGMFICLLARLFNLASRPASPVLYFTDSLFNQAIVSLCPRLKQLYTPTLLWGSSGHFQTIMFGKIGRFKCPSPVGERHSIVDRDGATVTFDVFEPINKETIKHDVTLVVCPGIANCSESIYIKTFVFYAQLKGYRIVCLNHLGSLVGVSLTAPKIFTYGGTEEYALMVDRVRVLFPDTRMIALGFSMGANIVIKYLGEDPSRQDLFSAAISCSQGYDILEIEPYIKSWAELRRMYDWSVTKHQKGVIRRHESVLFGEDAVKRYGEFDVQRLYESTSLKHIDTVYSYKRAGFSSCDEYYKLSSSRFYMDKIHIPVLLVNAMDDPLVPPQIHYIPKEFALSRSNVIFVVTKHGGHLGFFEGGVIMPNNVTWLDKVVIDYCNALLQVTSDAGLSHSLISTNSLPFSHEDIISPSLDAGVINNGIEKNGVKVLSL